MIEVRSIFCDDVRIEVNGKSILIGVYPGVLFASAGDVVKLSNWIEARGLERGKHTATISAFFDNGHEEISVADVAVDFTVADERFPAIFTPTDLHFVPDGPGTLAVRLSFDGSADLDAGKIPVIIPEPEDDELVNDESAFPDSVDFD
ncbi:hypothetical protein [Sinorhizobium fredii]|uniref:Uncharacterized protein n=1 Tax=Rhizobium fredii TaxID=380 RepID=A0A2L0H6N9_RHIFR|nr:hypothetical protein [Sinorhizobium fredii]AUX76429.1 hypothetical protein NXT3_CH01861 [Sinorhizobium fredii]